jgi:hypothetical protein
MFKDSNKVETTMNHGLSQDYTSGISVPGNVWERNGLALQLN